MAILVGGDFLLTLIRVLNETLELRRNINNVRKRFFLIKNTLPRPFDCVCNTGNSQQFSSSSGDNFTIFLLFSATQRMPCVN